MNIMKVSGLVQRINPEYARNIETGAKEAINKLTPSQVPVIKENYSIPIHNRYSHQPATQNIDNIINMLKSKDLYNEFSAKNTSYLYGKRTPELIEKMKEVPTKVLTQIKNKNEYGSFKETGWNKTFKWNKEARKLTSGTNFKNQIYQLMTNPKNAVGGKMMASSIQY